MHFRGRMGTTAINGQTDRHHSSANFRGKQQFKLSVAASEPIDPKNQRALCTEAGPACLYVGSYKIAHQSWGGKGWQKTIPDAGQRIR
jgi:hypothetical protein